MLEGNRAKLLENSVIFSSWGFQILRKIRFGVTEREREREREIPTKSIGKLSENH